MKIAHVADLHLGFRQYDRCAPGGMNQRERDVQDALARTVTDIIDQHPDLVLVGGDVFHSPRPPNAAIVFLSQQLERIRTALPETRVIIVAGNHDTPRSTEVENILRLYRRPGIDVVMGEVEQIHLLDWGVITCVPSSAVHQPFAPDPDAKYNVLLLHGVAPGAGYGDPDVTADQLSGWDYVALGDYHTVQQVGPNAWYSGSLEYTSSDPWSEARQHPAKGWLLVELGQSVTFRPIATRRFIDLPRIDADGFSPEQLDEAIAAVCDVDLKDTVARLVIENCPRDLQRAIDWTELRAFKVWALHLQVDFRRPEAQAITPAGRAMRRKKLEQIVDDFLGLRALPSDVNRDELRAKAQEYLEAAKDEADPYVEQQRVG